LRRLDVPGVVVEQVGHGNFRLGGNDDLGQVHLLFRKVEAGFVLFVERLELGVGDRNAGGDFLVEQLLDRQRSPHLGPEVLDAHRPALKVLFKGRVAVVGRAKLFDSGIHFRIDGHEPKFLSPLKHDLAVNHLPQEIEPQHGLLVFGCGGLGLINLALEVLLELGPSDGVAVDDRRDAVLGFGLASRAEQQKYED
jgi:hypothetical protein